jgi:hypothetical protein
LLNKTIWQCQGLIKLKKKNKRRSKKRQINRREGREGKNATNKNSWWSHEKERRNLEL